MKKKSKNRYPILLGFDCLFKTKHWNKWWKTNKISLFSEEGTRGCWVTWNKLNWASDIQARIYRICRKLSIGKKQGEFSQDEAKTFAVECGSGSLAHIKAHYGR